MSTLRTRALVSVFAAFALGACTTRTIASTADLAAPAPEAVMPLEIRFDNTSRDVVHVYLVGDSEEWRLGRVEPGATAWLPVPRRSLVSPGHVRVVALAGTTPSLQAGRDTRGMATLAQPLASVLQQRWVLTGGQLTSLWAEAPRVQPPAAATQP